MGGSTGSGQPWGSSPPGWQQAPPGWPHTAASGQIRPSRWWYGVAVAVLLAGIGVGTLLIVQAVGDLSARLVRIDAPGAARLELEAGTQQTIYLQTAGSASGSGRLDCTVAQVGGGRVPVSRAGNFTLTLGADTFVAQQTFTPPSTATYDVSCETGGGRLPAAVGPTIALGGTIARIGGAVAAFGLGAVLALVIAVVTALRRSSSKRGMSPAP